jgi:hypothetical protein
MKCRYGLRRSHRLGIFLHPLFGDIHILLLIFATLAQINEKHQRHQTIDNGNRNLFMKACPDNGCNIHQKKECLQAFSLTGFLPKTLTGHHITHENRAKCQTCFPHQRNAVMKHPTIQCHQKQHLKQAISDFMHVRLQR